MSNPSISVMNCGMAFSFASHLRQRSVKNNSSVRRNGGKSRGVPIAEPALMFRGTWNFSTPAMRRRRQLIPATVARLRAGFAEAKDGNSRATDGEKMTPAKAARADAVLAASRCNQHEQETPDVRVLYTPYQARRHCSDAA